ncbi:tetrathionate reductase family octaheme c-type cytochrome [Marimonas arenosa]|uniref:Tetrathionate reductase family octaheme c-type cytochrome n=1 Tax=Marimonas arenosa TaxID=1795305 RepID=A0AAE3W903_9RHOB|nr:tetrathionate reductase family octaheme c-type cytochrome [Marimonas arenosa]MDQ2088586.1 tetrathionate reductase family octaheme c-type cytochrome [Marimonas arenosa]
MKNLRKLIAAVGIGAVVTAPALASETTGAKVGTPPAGPKSITAPGTSTADHSKFEILKKEFASGPDVTEACLSCHTEASDQVQHSIHYSWDFTHPDTGQSLGKSKVINAFCGSVAGNEPRCTSCHVGYGWKDMSQPPPQAASAVDCLVCHDRSGQYAKSATGAGHVPPPEIKPGMITMTGAPAWPVDLNKAAQSVGLPGRDNCGNCHFYGGGGDNVKHGDLSSALYMPEESVDVHMSPDGENMVCATCHVSDKHQWPGSRYDVTATDPHANDPLKPGERRDVATCESCHSDSPHPATLAGLKLDDHTNTLACQTCHIPSFARGGVATKTLWDWSTAGQKDENGKIIKRKGYTQADGKELPTYVTMKGGMAYGEDVVPYYAWFDGQVEYANAEREIDPTGVVDVNSIKGDPNDGQSRIWPFKRMEGRQAYDKGLNRLVFTHVFGPGSDTAYWGNFDWNKAIAAGMQKVGLDYSGEYGFVDTYMYWPITHMVAPAEQALSCVECHSADGRMAGLAGVFLPGTDSMNWAGMLGRLMVLAALLGVLAHGAIRLLSGKEGEQ